MNSVDTNHFNYNKTWADRIFPLVMAVSIAASSWFLNQAWAKINILESKVQAIEIAFASTNGNRFTNSDWISAKSSIDDENNLLDRRIMRVEESIPVIKDALLEIKTKLKQ